MRNTSGFGKSSLAAALLFTLSCGVDTNPPAEKTGGRYVISSIVFGDDTDTTYLSVLPSLDDVDIDLRHALEVPGRASVTAYGPWLFVGAGESPEITRYSVSERGDFIEEKTLSFGNEDLGGWGLYIDDWGNTFISEHKAYLSNSSASTIIWDPTTMEIVGHIPQPELARDAPLTADGSPGFVRGERLYRTFFWKNWDEYETLPEQYLAVYDVKHDQLLELVPETRCPGMNYQVSPDEAGALYFSNWVYNVTETLGRGAPESCALRLPAGSDRFDEEFQLPFSELAEGRQGAGLSYLAAGRGIFAAFHDEQVSLDADTDLQELALSTNWRLWGVDLNERTAAPLDGVGWLAGGYSMVRVDGQTFLMVPGAEYADTTVHAISADGHVEKRFEIPGDSYQILKLE